MQHYMRITAVWDCAAGEEEQTKFLHKALYEALKFPRKINSLHCEESALIPKGGVFRSVELVSS